MAHFSNFKQRWAGRVSQILHRVSPKAARRAEFYARRWRIQRALPSARLSLTEVAADRRPAVVFFAPEAGVVPHFMAHCLLARTLQERGHRVLIVGCWQAYPRCIVMDGVGLPQQPSEFERQHTCVACAKASVEMAMDYGLDVVDIGELLGEPERAEVSRNLADLPGDLSTVKIDGIRFGEICGAEAAVTFKVLDFKGEDPAVRLLLVRYLQGALQSYYAMQRLAATIRVTRIVYFSEYAVLLGAVLAARKTGIATTNMTMASLLGVDRRRIVLMPELLAIASYRDRLDRWPQWRSLALPADRIAEIGDDCLYRISSNSIMVYSPSRSGSVDELFKHLNLSPERRVLAAFTSSLDEIGANNQLLGALGLGHFPDRQPFRDQIEWLEALIDWVEPSADLQLVIRIHPREGANRRDKVASHHLEVLRERFSKPYRHVRIVWPTDNISSYDLMELAHVGLSGWSSTALEMARFGLPVVVAFDLHIPYPVGDVVTWHHTREGFFRCLVEAIASAPSLDRIRLAYRWSNLRSLGCAVDFSDVVPRSDFHGLPHYKTPAAAQNVEEILIGTRTALELNQEALERRQGASADTAETEALLQQLRRCIWFLSLGEHRGADYRLFLSTSQRGSVPDGYDAAFYIGPGEMEFRTPHRMVGRHSRMVERMARLAAQSLHYVEA